MSAYVIYELLTAPAPDDRMTLALEAASGSQPVPVIGEQVEVTASKRGEYGNLTFLVEVVCLRRSYNVQVRDHGQHDRNLGYHTAYVRVVDGPSVPF